MRQSMARSEETNAGNIKKKSKHLAKLGIPLELLGKIITAIKKDVVLALNMGITAKYRNEVILLG